MRSGEEFRQGFNWDLYCLSGGVTVSTAKEGGAGSLNEVRVRVDQCVWLDGRLGGPLTPLGAAVGRDLTQYPAFAPSTSESVCSLFSFLFIIVPIAHACSYFLSLIAGVPNLWDLMADDLRWS